MEQLLYEATTLLNAASLITGSVNKTEFATFQALLPAGACASRGMLSWRR